MITLAGPIRSRILMRLAAGAGDVVTHEALLAAMYGDDPDGGPDGALACLHVLVHRLRRELPPGAITTHRAIGYSLCPRVARHLGGIDARELVPRADT